MKASQNRMNRVALSAASHVQAARQHAGVVGDDADGPAAQTRQGHHHVAGKMGVGLEEIPVVHDGADDVVHVVRLPRRCPGRWLSNSGASRPAGSAVGAMRRVFHIIVGQKA